MTQNRKPEKIRNFHDFYQTSGLQTTVTKYLKKKVRFVVIWIIGTDAFMLITK